MNPSPAYSLHKLVAALDRGADTLLRKKFDITYNRALFLVVVRDQGSMTQHELAVALGYSDPAVSAMLVELAKDGFVTSTPSPTHGRKRMVRLTAKGRALTDDVKSYLDKSFADVLMAANVDAAQYHELTERIYQTVVGKKEAAHNG